ncbi:MAG: cation-translocating P-type ATPase, partial [Acholeplasma sp.]
MTKFIYKQKNNIMIVSFILIVIGFIAHFGYDNDLLFNITFITASVIGLIPIALQAYQALRVKVISIDLLVTIAVLGAFIIREFEESAIVTFLFLFGAYLEQRTLIKTRSAIKALTDMAPESALKLMADGQFVDVEVDDVDVDDTLLVKTGFKVPVDGEVLSGMAYINEASITGESVAVKKIKGSKVFAGTIIDNGTIQFKAQKVGEDTTFGKIIELVEQAQDSKSTAEKFIDKFAAWYTPFVLVLAFIVGILTKDVPLAITILVLGCPGALVIGVPVANVAGIGNGARHGVLLKGSEVINDLSRTDTVVFDKTGTLTTGHPVVRKTYYFEADESQINSYIYSVEKESGHPLAKAIIEYIKPVNIYEVTNTSVVQGGGISAMIASKHMLIGNPHLMQTHGVLIPEAILSFVQALEVTGHAIVLTAINKKVVSLMGVRDDIRQDIKTDLQKLRTMGIKNLIVLSGDNQGAVDVIAKELGLTKALGNMLPDDKAAYIKILQDKGHIVTFVGDG